MQLFSELKRRTVVRVGAAFVVVVILVLAAERSWVAQKTAVGLVETKQDIIDGPTDKPATIEHPATPREKTIAVLPFVNQGATGESTQFLSDGIHDDLLTQLSRIDDLKVISRTSVMAYRNTTKNTRDIGRELGVGNLLEGLVQQVGDQVRIYVQLTDAATDSHIWAETYDTEITTDNLFRIRGEIAQAIVLELEAKLSEEESQRLTSAPTSSFDAYRAVLLSRQYEQRNGFDANRRSAEFARKAIELDPEYADAHIALANALSTGIGNGLLGHRETAPEISAAIDRAMALDPENPAAWSALGNYRLRTLQPGVANGFEKALELDPNNARTMGLYGFALLTTPDPEKSLALLLKAVELDPLSVPTLFALGRAYGLLGEFESARSIFARIRQTDPKSPLGYGPVGATYLEQGRLDQGLYWLSLAQAVDPEDFETAGWMVFVYDGLEHHEGARSWSAWLDNWITKQPQPMAMQAKHHYLNGNFELALQYANLAINLDLESRWSSEITFMRIKRDEAISNGDPLPGIAFFLERYPGLRESDPQLSPKTLQQAVHLASLLSLYGQKETARTLLEAAIETYDRPYTVAGPHHMALAPVKAEALAILGRQEEALAELRRIIDNGWRINWRWSTDLNSSFNGIRDAPEFRALVQELAIDIAAQRISVEDMEAEGKIGPPAAPNRGLDLELIQ